MRRAAMMLEQIRETETIEQLAARIRAEKKL